VEATCSEYENGTPLHMAAANLSVAAARVLISFGADVDALDDLARKPVDCVPDPGEDFGLIPDAPALAQKMSAMLSSGKKDISRTEKEISADDTVVSSRTVLKALNMQLGDRVLVNGDKFGTLRFCGPTAFATGTRVGVALDQPEGKNDGTVAGVAYFRCPPDHGIFVAPSKVAKVGKHYKQEERPSSRQPLVVNRGKVDTSRVASRLTECLEKQEKQAEIRVGDRVLVASEAGGHVLINSGPRQRRVAGTVRFVGSVDFDTGADEDEKWFGVELDEPVGRHDGAVMGVRYFSSAPDTGIFVTAAKLTKATAEEIKAKATRSGRSSSAAGRAIEEEAKPLVRPSSSRPVVRRAVSMRLPSNQSRAPSRLSNKVFFHDKPQENKVSQRFLLTNY
jgi:CAP-Gly domain-containing linker protein 3/4